jgi:hypothetical protein
MSQIKILKTTPTLCVMVQLTHLFVIKHLFKWTITHSELKRTVKQ